MYYVRSSVRGYRAIALVTAAFACAVHVRLINGPTPHTNNFSLYRLLGVLTLYPVKESLSVFLYNNSPVKVLSFMKESTA